MAFHPVTHVLFDMDGLILSPKKLIEHLNKKNIPVVLATNLSEECFNLKVGKHEKLFFLFVIKMFGTSYPEVKNMTLPGYIFDTEDLYTIGFQQIAGRYGKEFTFSLKSKIMGQQSKEFAKSIVEALQLPLSADQFAAEARALFDELFPRCCVLPGAEKLLRHLHENNVPIGLATSSSKESYDLKTTNHQPLFDLFPYKTWGSSDPDVKRGKPSPDIFLVAANKFADRPPPHKCLVFEDSLNGVRAARAAGMQAVMVPDARLDRALAADATLVLNSLTEFRPELFGLPPFED